MLLRYSWWWWKIPYGSCIVNTVVVVVDCVILMVSPDVVGIGSEYFAVYIRISCVPGNCYMFG